MFRVSPSSAVPAGLYCGRPAADTGYVLVHRGSRAGYADARLEATREAAMHGRMRTVRVIALRIVELAIDELACLQEGNDVAPFAHPGEPFGAISWRAQHSTVERFNNNGTVRRQLSSQTVRMASRRFGHGPPKRSITTANPSRTLPLPPRGSPRSRPSPERLSVGADRKRRSSDPNGHNPQMSDNAAAARSRAGSSRLGSGLQTSTR
jgi:hypothetical protein